MRSRLGRPTVGHGELAATAYVVVAWWAGRRDLPVVCPYRRLTGRRCPACGLTRSIACVLRGELRCAVAEHPLGPAVVAGVAAAFLRRLWLRQQVRRAPAPGTTAY
ncbi:MAG: DUF2752 domain-containing protein [Pseudonocardiaceae bacterium]